MKYIEFLGISSSGKSYLSSKLENKLKHSHRVFSPKQLILDYYYREFNHGTVELIKIFLLKFLNLSVIIIIKNNHFNKKIISKKKKIILSNKSKISTSYNFFSLDEFYISILNKLFSKFDLDKNNFVFFAKKEIDFLNESYAFKKRLNRWFLESLIALIISKRMKAGQICIANEGVIQRLFIIYSLHSNKKNFLQGIKKYSISYGKIIVIKIIKNKLDLYYNFSKKRKTGYIYSSKKEVKESYNNIIKFINGLKYKIKFEFVYNNFKLN